MSEVSTQGLLLDTHVWIWLNEGLPELKMKLISQIDAAAQGPGVFISAISIWEIATLASKKRLILRTSLEDWVRLALGQVGVELIPLSPDIAIESNQLPEHPHGDPADRIIMATARIKQLALVTRDQSIIEYSKQGYLKTLKA